MKWLIKKHCKSLLPTFLAFILVLTLWPSAALAEGETGTTADNLEWVVLAGDTSVKITGYSGSVAPGTTIAIPATVDTGLAYGTLPVTELGDYAFNGDNNLAGLDLSGATNLTKIGSSALNYTHITTLDIPGTVTTLSYAAFADNYYLTTVTMHDGTTNLSEAIFANCSQLSSVTLPGDLQNITYYMFGSCTALESITIPSSVTFIAQGAFAGSGLLGITIPDSVTSMTGDTFKGCPKMGTNGITLSANCSMIAGGMFQDCPMLTSFTIPSTVAWIGQDAFRNSGLTSITLPASITNVLPGAFAGCNSLPAIDVDSGSTHYMSNGGVLYDISGQTLVVYPSGKSGSSFSVPDGVQAIGTQAFDCCANLTDITLPASVTNINYGAFVNCTNLLRLFVYNDSITFGESLFDGATDFLSDGCIYGHDPSNAKDYAAANSYDFILLLELSASPSDGNIYTGGRIVITPNLEGGTWDWDEEYLSATFNSPATFTGLKAGTTTVTYTAGAQSAGFDITISQSNLPRTGQEFTIAFLLLAASALALGAALFVKRRIRA